MAIGLSVPRLEDGPLLRGAGRFTDDLHFDGETSLAFVRSDRAAGTLLEVDVSQALAMPGVIGAMTAADLSALGIGHLRPTRLPPGSNGDAVHVPPYPPLADGRVHHVGQPVAAILAETRAQAEAAAETVRLEIAEAPVAVDLAAARTSPPVWDASPGNRVFVHETGDASAVAAAFGAAAHLVSQRLVISRVTAATMEPRGAIGLHDPGSGHYTLHAGTQSPHGLAAGMAALMGMPTGHVRVVSENCGGSFGMRNAPAPEYAVVLAAARRFARPVRWIESRSEAFLADPQAREQIVDATLALDENGRFLAVGVEIAAAMGAFVGPSTLHSSYANLGSLAGVYRIPAIHARVEGLHLNTQTMASYRGAGRPEATYIIERMVDIAAARLGMDRVALRRSNMIAPGDMPYRTPLGYVYDSGDFEGTLDAALAAADWEEFETRRAATRARGRLRGRGLACSIEIAGGPATTPAPEYARVELSREGCTVRLGTGDAGQGHRTTFAQIAGAALGLPPHEIRVVAGDTRAVARGTGTFGSRSVGAAGTALRTAAEDIITRLRDEAAEHFEAAPADIEVHDGMFRVTGTDRSIRLRDLVAARDLRLHADRHESAAAPTYPCGCHVVEIEIDPDTGAWDVQSYLAVEDLGNLVNPALAEGQIHGGVAQGLGQALGEAIRYDPQSGQLLTGSFQDYAMPRAADLPSIQFLSRPTATSANPLGTKGAGEAGTVGALAAAISAISDALSPLGITHVDMPATSFAIWSEIRKAANRPGVTSSAGC